MLKKCSYCLIAIIHCSGVSGTRLIASSAWAARETERASLAETREAWAAGTLPFLRSFLPGHPTLQALFPLPALCSSPHPHPITTTPYPPRPQLTSLLISECEDLNELPCLKRHWYLKPTQMVELMTLPFVKGIGGLREKVRMIFVGPRPSFRASFSRSWEPGTRVVPILDPCAVGECAPPGSVDSPFNKCIVSKYHVQGTTWGTRNTVVSKTDTTVPFWYLHAGGALK